jgi:hypothetical protein
MRWRGWFDAKVRGHSWSMAEDLFLSDQHPLSKRWAIVEDDGSTAWLYLTEPGTTQPVADCWLYNRGEAPPALSFGSSGVPIVPTAHTNQVKGCEPPKASQVRLQWTVDGNGVAVWFQTELMGFIAGPQGAGYSRYLKAAGPFGAPLDQSVYVRVFGEA